jgi:hypothetical protein
MENESMSDDRYEIGRQVGYFAGYENGRDNGMDMAWDQARSEIKRLEDLVLAWDGNRCEACDRVFNEGEYGEDCWLCHGCADELRKAEA